MEMKFVPPVRAKPSSSVDTIEKTSSSSFPPYVCDQTNTGVSITSAFTKVIKNNTSIGISTNFFMTFGLFIAI